MDTVVNSPHPDAATLFAFRCGRLIGEKHAAVEEHLVWCAECSGGLDPGKRRSTPDVPPSDSADVPEPLVDHPRYRILGRIGEGGMGVVYKAEHRVMGRVVALKVLSKGVTADQTAIDRFRREVRLASRLSHHNIVTAYDADEAGGLHFLVMEFVDGVSLDRLVKDRGQLPVAMACEYARQAAIGLQHAHEKGMVHRDVKPHNLMVTRTGVVKILDFGLARVASPDDADPTSLTALALTKPQTLMGTPDFLSPEQARSSTLDVRSDLYSLGCTLYYLLAGKPPFSGASTYAKMIAHFKEPAPDLNASRPDTPRPLADLLQKLMAKSPDDRYQTPTEVAKVLLPFAGSSNVEVNPGPRFREAPAVTACDETLPSYATDAALPLLPMASEFDASLVESHLEPLPECEPQEEPTPVKKRRRLLGLAVVVLLGLGLGGLASKFNKPRDVQTDDVATTTQPTSPKGTATQPPSEPPPSPQPKTVPTTKPVQALTPTPVPTSRRKQVLLIIPGEFANGELTAVSETLKQRGVVLLTAAPEKKSLEGYRLVDKAKTIVRTYDPQYALRDVTGAFLDSVDAVILMPGETSGFAPRGPAGLDVQRLVEKAAAKKKVIGAIGSGVVILAWHGFFEDHEASTVPSRPSSLDLKKVKKWKDDPKVVIDLPFITSGEHSHAKSLADEVVKAIGNPSHQ